MLPAPAKVPTAEAAISTPAPLAIQAGEIDIPCPQLIGARPSKSCRHLLYCTWLC
jgi:hypothetical protein